MSDVEIEREIVLHDDNLLKSGSWLICCIIGRKFT